MPTSPSTQVRQHILDTARPIMVHKGFSAVGLNEILAAAGIPKGSFYHYFGSKEAFGEALLQSYFDSYLEHVDNLLVRSKGSAADRLLIYWQNWLDTQANDDYQCKCLAVKLGAEVSDLSDAMRQVLQDGSDRVIGRLAACIEAGRADGSLVDIADSTHTAAALYQLWMGATLVGKMRRDRKPLETAMTTTRQLLNLPPRRRRPARP
ncbi:MAG TPA: TetR/AcrR family transcriptional regulator [Trinickia sp.]|nr:TetR/AcrR family transcriptional regulator [Trinickia sp.]